MMYIKAQFGLGLKSKIQLVVSHGIDKLKMGVNFDFEIKFELEGQGQSTQTNRDLNQGLLHLWSKFGDPSLNGWWVIARTSKCLPHTQTDGRTHRQIDAGNDNTRRSKLASGKNLPACFIQLNPKLYISKYFKRSTETRIN